MSKTSAAPRVDVYTKITNQIVAQLEQGVRPWLRPWHADHAAGRVSRPLRYNGKPYSGINILSLWITAEQSGFASPFWLTFQQALELGGHVRKGEHGVTVVYASIFTKSEETDSGEEVEEKIPFLKQYTVFCADQCDGLPEHFYQLATPPAETLDRIERADRFFAATGADIRTGGNQAFYAIDADYVRMPPSEALRDAESHTDFRHFTHRAFRESPPIQHVANGYPQRNSLSNTSI